MDPQDAKEQKQQSNTEEKGFVEKSVEKYLSMLDLVEKESQPPAQAMMILGYAIYFQRLYNKEEVKTNYSNKVINTWKNVEEKAYKVLDIITEKNKQVYLKARELNKDKKNNQNEGKNS